MDRRACVLAAGLFVAFGGISLEAQTASAPVTGKDAPASWPGWRGPTGCGNTDEKDLPVSWSAKDNANVIWKAELPKSVGVSPSSPIVVGDSVIVTTAVEKPSLEHHVACLSTKDGALRWMTPVEPGPLTQMDGRAGAAPSTPCTDGQYVFAMFGSAVIAALDLKDGREKWRQELKDTAFDCGIGGSPVVFGQTVLFVADQTKGKSAVYAWDCRTGELKFQEKRPKADFAHSTPIFVKVAGTDCMIVSANKALQGLDPLTGKTLWWAAWGDPKRWVGDVSSPVFGGGLIYSDSGRGDQVGASLKPGGAGDVSKENLEATFACKTDLGSPIVVGEFVYRNFGNRVQCMRLQTGEIVYTQPLKGINPWASPVATADRVYYATAGKSCVLKAGPKFELLGEGDLGDNNPASPAVADGRLFLKGAKFLWCVGEKAGSATGPATAAGPAASRPSAAPERPAAATTTSAPDGGKGKWVIISEGPLKKLLAEGKKVGWPGGGGGTAGVAVDRTTGYVYMVLSDHGLWMSKDQGATFERVDGGAVAGRCETGFSLDVDPNGKRIMCNMVYGSSGMVLDSGAGAVKSGATHFDCGAADWSDGKTLLAVRHESGGMACVSADSGVTWKNIGKGFKGVGVFDSKTFVATRGKEEPGIFRSEDAGATWNKVSDLVPTGLSMKVFKGVGYWTSKGGLLVSKDKGATWAVQGKPIECCVGPLIGRDEKHLIVAAKEGLMETTDGGDTWKLAVPYPENVKYDDKGWYPFSIKFNPGGSFGNYAWDPQGDAFYASAIGQPTWRHRR